MDNRLNRKPRRKKSKSYYMGIMVLFIICVMYMIMYPQFGSSNEGNNAGSSSSELSSYEPAENSAQLLTDDEKSDAKSAAEAAISAIEERDGKTYNFRYPDRLSGHFEKHGAEMGFSSEEEYLEGANALINNPEALHKTEAEDGDDIYYLESTNEIAFVSTDGYIRTYFICSGKAYYDRQ
ncbi:hypothetical protein [Butyrivibrio sp. INlla16]|uniref:hypothetical protein n=1 Tax=Butyrivibrio sp. INlla16 TaxID=1520807 RepID=UPI00088EADE6|nr:hypothetical protein [Butyrivibrio sp. INlla16]SDB28696.1 hypothetical protein SAMN02910263_01391 [Butyrivibrio sp. INlla16]